MSFTGFLKQVGKIAFGYLGAAVLFMTAVGVAMQGYTKTGVVLGIFAMVLALYGVYSEKGL